MANSKIAIIKVMIDKPVPAKIFLKLKDKKDTGEELISLSGTLYQQNLIFSEPRELRRKGTRLELTVVFRDLFSYNNWQKTIGDLEFWTEKFKSLLSEEPKTKAEKDVIIEVDQVFNCSCQQPEFYILQGRSLQYGEELTCGTCLGQVSYSRIPLQIEIENWQNHYQRVYLNWLESSFFEKEAFKELTNYEKGELNIEGEKIRSQLSAYFKIPVYMLLFSYESANQNCLICGSTGTKSGLNSPKKNCMKCNTIFGFEDQL